MIPFTLTRYFAWRFLGAALAVFGGVFVLVVLIDYVELMRRASQIPNVSAWTVAKTSFFRVPQVTERLMPFAVLIGAMSCFLNLSRRLELIVARAAGMSASCQEQTPQIDVSDLRRLIRSLRLQWRACARLQTCQPSDATLSMRT